MISSKFQETDLHTGDTVRVHSTVVEGSKTRIQVFEGMILAFSGRGENRTFTVRRFGVGGIGVERIWPLNARSLVKVEVKKKAGNVRRSKLYYLRNLTGKQAASI